MSWFRNLDWPKVIATAGAVGLAVSLSAEYVATKDPATGHSALLAWAAVFGFGARLHKAAIKPQ